jgi:predicted nucleic acid-binding protein
VAEVLLDTNIFSYVLNGHDIAKLYEKHLDGQQQTLCFAVVAELIQGARKRGWGPAKVARLESSIKTLTVIPYDVGVCRAWADLHDAQEP